MRLLAGITAFGPQTVGTLASASTTESLASVDVGVFGRPLMSSRASRSSGSRNLHGLNMVSVCGEMILPRQRNEMLNVDAGGISAGMVNDKRSGITMSSNVDDSVNAKLARANLDDAVPAIVLGSGPNQTVALASRSGHDSSRVHSGECSYCETRYSHGGYRYHY